MTPPLAASRALGKRPIDTLVPAIRSRELAPLKRARPHYDDIAPRPLESDYGYWEWYPAALQTMIHEERVPPPRAWDTPGGAPTLPAVLYPPEQAFAAMVARLDRREREMHFMREIMMRSMDARIGEVTDKCTRLSEYTSERFVGFGKELKETDKCHTTLVKEFYDLKSTVTDLTTRLEESESARAALVIENVDIRRRLDLVEERPAGNPQADPVEDPEEDSEEEPEEAEPEEDSDEEPEEVDQVDVEAGPSVASTAHSHT